MYVAMCECGYVCVCVCGMCMCVCLCEGGVSSHTPMEAGCYLLMKITHDKKKVQLQNL
eukprot:m.36796 g.36796  ORF g.36796 m.36796 type:complete len:58 (+) comp17454_c0_seq1:27-200(+)